eukprot:TRINITY_DN12735_c0_g1_i1.p2 TRINITY_DN12735_c0_g1~~TRINITY_DN12735_c0_g1_i1.p2  ORF type:complete len:187 (+),score=73.22 TRINITY_DN12735_c0_g1_i1:149-709(+)
MPTLRCKLIVLGDACVGKSALIQMFKSDGAVYPKNYTMTIGCDLSQKATPIAEKKTTVEFYLFDIAGQELYRDLIYSYLEGAALVAICYDASNPASFQSVAKWAEIAKGESEKAPPGVLIATKLDLEERVVIKTEQGQQLANSLGLKFFETSALRGTGIELPFQHLAKQFLGLYEEKMKLYETLRY